MRLTFTLVSILYFLSIFLPVFALPPGGVPTSTSLAARNDPFSVVEVPTPPGAIVLKKRGLIGAILNLIKGVVAIVRKIVHAVHSAHHGKKAAHAVKHAKNAKKVADHAQDAQSRNNNGNNNGRNNGHNNGPNNGPNNGRHRRRSLPARRGEQANPKLGNQMKRSLARQKQGLKRRMIRQLEKRESNTVYGLD